MTPDLGAKVNGREDGGSVYPDVVEDVGTEWSDKGKGMGVKVGDAGDIAKEVAVNELFLWNPKFLTAVVDNGVLMRVPVSDEGTSGGGEEVREDVG